MRTNLCLWISLYRKLNEYWWRPELYNLLFVTFRSKIIFKTNSNWKILKTFSWVSWVTLKKFEANRSRGSWVMIGQTNKQRLQLYIYTEDSLYIINNFVGKKHWLTLVTSEYSCTDSVQILRCHLLY